MRTSLLETGDTATGCIRNNNMKIKMDTQTGIKWDATGPLVGWRDSDPCGGQGLEPPESIKVLSI